MTYRVHQPFAVGARHRTERAIRFVRTNERAPRFTIELPNLKLPEATCVAARGEFIVLFLCRRDAIRMRASEKRRRYGARNVHPDEPRVTTRRGAVVRRNRRRSGRGEVRTQARHLQA